MIETILAGFTKDVVKSLADLATNEIAKVLFVKNEINKLKSKLETIAAVSRDAEKTVAQYETTRDWLKQLREITYEIENIIDRCRIEEERLQTAHPQVRGHLKFLNLH